MRLLLVLLTTAVLYGCGGGGGGGNSAPGPASPVPPAPVRDAPPLVLYFGVVAKQLEETSDHCTCMYPMDWGDWDDPAARDWISNNILAQLKEGKQLGFTTAIVAVGFTMFTKKYAYRGTADLAAFKQKVDAAGGPKVVGISIVDEPDMAGISDEVMTKAILEAKFAWPGVEVFVVYGDHGTPGIVVADVVGRDKYPDLVTLPVKAGQKQWLFAGGSDPWRVDPAPFVAYAQSHPEVGAICGFLWGDGWSGTTNKGIGTNGMAAAYRSAFKPLSGRA